MPGSLSSILTGEWKVSSAGFQEGDVEFKSDGTYIDEDEVLVFNPNQETMTYTIDSDVLFRIHVQLISQVSYNVTVSDYTCDEISLSVSGLDYTLSRK